jgi:hypothetical protein
MGLLRYDMKLKRPLIMVTLILLILPAIALADNGMNVIKPFQSYGTYGYGTGQIGSPISVRMDAQDNMFVLLDTGASGKHRRIVSVYDRNFTYVRSFDVVKTSMVDPGLDRAPYGRNLYYDNLAKAMDIGSNGNIYVLSGTEVLVFGNDGGYTTQFPVSSFMTWIGSNGNETWFYYPSCILAGNNGTVIITSGNSPKHEIITIGPDARLKSKSDMPDGNAYELASDHNGHVYMIGSGSSTMRVYNSTMSYENDFPLQYNNSYDSNPASIAFFSDGNFTVSANGIYVYYPNGSVITQFMDNNKTAAGQNWGRLIAVNSSDFLVVVGNYKDSVDTPQPILTYKYVNGTVIGEQPKKEQNNSFCPGILGPFYLVYLAIKSITGT